MTFGILDPASGFSPSGMLTPEIARRGRPVVQPASAALPSSASLAALGPNASPGQVMAAMLNAGQGGVGGGREPGERGDLGAGVHGGNLLALAGMLAGPMSFPLSALAGLAVSDFMDQRPSISVFDTFFGGDSTADLGRAMASRRAGGPQTRAEREFASRRDRERRERGLDRPVSEGGPGRSPNRGDVSNAGR